MQIEYLDQKPPSSAVLFYVVKTENSKGNVKKVFLKNDPHIFIFLLVTKIQMYHFKCDKP